MKNPAQMALWRTWLDQPPADATLRQLDRWLRPSLWRHAGSTGAHCWGEVRTRGSLHYKVAADQGQKHFTCTCSGKQHPCTHVLALILLISEGDLEGPLQTLPPDWATVPSPLPVPAAEKSRPKAGGILDLPAERLQEWTRGYAFLQGWLKDQTRMGWQHSLEPPARHVEEAAARLVTYRLPGPARLLRSLLEPTLSGEGPTDRLMEVLPDLVLACRYMAMGPGAAPDTWEAFVLFSGVTLRREQIIAAQPATQDFWLVIDRRESAEQDLKSRETWVCGLRSGRFAQLLDFAWKRQPLPPAWPPGHCWEGTLHFYPGPAAFRALPGEGRFMGLASDYALPLTSSWSLLREQLTRQRALNPWARQVPVCIRGALRISAGQQLLLTDTALQGLPVLLDKSAYPDLLALQTGEAISYFGLVNGRGIRLRSLWQHTRLLALLDG